MRIKIARKPVTLYPDNKRVIARFFFNNSERTQEIIRLVDDMSEEEATTAIRASLREFAKRHRHIADVFRRHFRKIIIYFNETAISPEELSDEKKLLLGSYFTMEYSVESSGLFNPSIIEDVDQSGLEEGEKRVIVSLRGVGEGHISSIVFRRGIIDRNNNLEFEVPDEIIDEAEFIINQEYKKKRFKEKLVKSNGYQDIHERLFEGLNEKFTYNHLLASIKSILGVDENEEDREALERVKCLAEGHYESQFSLDTDISARVIFPNSDDESHGVEDARFTKFTEENGETTFYATYTAYDGVRITPKLLETKDFCHFKIIPLFGKGARDKDLALFPRKINSKYVMLSRVDGVNGYIMFSDRINMWDNPILLQERKYPWEMIQLGNSGPPIETDRGWLVITHAVGQMRKYCLGASLLDLNDPSIEIGRLKVPLIMPDENEREGYVPNVVYSCGSIVHEHEIIIPYAVSDYSSTFAVVSLDKLLNKILED